MSFLQVFIVNTCNFTSTTIKEEVYFSSDVKNTFLSFSRFQFIPSTSVLVNEKFTQIIFILSIMMHLQHSYYFLPYFISQTRNRLHLYTYMIVLVYSTDIIVAIKMRDENENIFLQCNVNLAIEIREI